MEVCAGFELITIENATALGDGSLEIGEGLEGAVDERLIQNRQRCSAGCSSGECRGRSTSRSPFGTIRLGAVCQPALSSPSTMMRSRPAPASRANSASRAAKNGLEMPFDMDQKVSPEIGCPKAVPYSPL